MALAPETSVLQPHGPGLMTQEDAVGLLAQWRADHAGSTAATSALIAQGPKGPALPFSFVVAGARLMLIRNRNINRVPARRLPIAP